MVLAWSSRNSLALILFVAYSGGFSNFPPLSSPLSAAEVSNKLHGNSFSRFPEAAQIDWKRRPINAVTNLNLQQVEKDNESITHDELGEEDLSWISKKDGIEKVAVPVRNQAKTVIRKHLRPLTDEAGRLQPIPAEPLSVSELSDMNTSVVSSLSHRRSHNNETSGKHNGPRHHPHFKNPTSKFILAIFAPMGILALCVVSIVLAWKYFKGSSEGKHANFDHLTADYVVDSFDEDSESDYISKPRSSHPNSAFFRQDKTRKSLHQTAA